MTLDVDDYCCGAGNVRKTSWGAVVRARGRWADVSGMVGYISDPPSRAYRKARQDLQPPVPDGELSTRQVIVLGAAGCFVFIPALHVGAGPFWACLASIFFYAVGIGVWTLISEHRGRGVTTVWAESGSALEALLHGCMHRRSLPVIEQAAKCLISRVTPEPSGLDGLVAELTQAWELGWRLSQVARDETYSALLEVAQDTPATDDAVVTVRAGVKELVTSIRQSIAANERVRAAIDAPVTGDALQQQQDDDAAEVARAVSLADQLREVANRVGMEAEASGAEIHARDNLTVPPHVA